MGLRIPIGSCDHQYLVLLSEKNTNISTWIPEKLFCLPQRVRVKTRGKSNHQASKQHAAT